MCYSRCFVVLAFLVTTAASSRADVFRWDNGLLIPGTEGITPGPGVQLDHHELAYAMLGFLDLTGSRFDFSNLSFAHFFRSNLTNANLSGANLANADLRQSTLTNANLSGAVVTWAGFDDATGFTKEQLYSTASYQAKDLTGISLQYNDLSDCDFSGQNLANGHLDGATLTNADLSGAVMTGTRFRGTTSTGFTKEQLYSTASYQAKNLTGIWLSSNDLSDWDFSGQNLANADLRATLTNANLSGAVVTGADFGYTTSHGFTKQQLYSTASYQAKNLTGIKLFGNNLSGWDFSGQVITGAQLYSTPGFTKEQLYATASYQTKNLAGIDFGDNDLSGWDFSGQNLANASVRYATLTNADLSGAVVTGANFYATTGFTPEQLYSTASYQAKNLAGIQLENRNLSGWDFHGQNLANAYLPGARLTNANLNGADTRGAFFGGATLAGANTSNLIQANGHIAGLDLTAGASLVVRDYDGNPAAAPPTGPLPIVVEQHLVTDATGMLRLEFDADPWDSTISFAPGIPVTLGGTLELAFASDVNVAAQSGRTIDLFDWTGVTPTGAFTTVSSPYTWNLSQLYTTGEVTLSIPLAGDYNASGTVGPEDYSLWRANFGSTTLLAADGNGNGIIDAADYVLWRNIFQATAAMSGDYNQNGTVDAADYVVWRNGLGTIYAQTDYDVWRSHFGTVSPGIGAASGADASANAAVPEPATLVLLMFAAAGWCLRRGRAE